MKYFLTLILLIILSCMGCVTVNKETNVYVNDVRVELKGDKMIHENSKESHKEHEGTGRGATYRARVVDLLATTGKAMTDREIQSVLGVVEKSNIQPEVTRLRQAGVIEECGKVECPVTGKNVRTVRIKEIVQ